MFLGGRPRVTEDGVTILDLEKGEVIRVLSGHEATIVSLDFSPEGKLLASGSHGGTGRIWNLAALAHPPPEEGSDSSEALVLDSHESGVYHLRFSGGSRRLLSASHREMIVFECAPALAALQEGRSLKNPVLVDWALSDPLVMQADRDSAGFLSADLAPDGLLDRHGR